MSDKSNLPAMDRTQGSFARFLNRLGSGSQRDPANGPFNNRLSTANKPAVPRPLLTKVYNAAAAGASLISSPTSEESDPVLPAAAEPATTVTQVTPSVAKQFPGKDEQQKQVSALIQSNGFIPKELVDHEVTWFYSNLGMDDLYFRLETPESIAKHILSLYSAKIDAFVKQESLLNFHLTHETEDGAIFIQTSTPGVNSGQGYEKKIDATYLNKSSVANGAYRMESFRSQSAITSSSFSTHLRSYFVRRCSFPLGAGESTSDSFDIREIADPYFIENATEVTLISYQRIIVQVLSRTGVVIEVQDVPHSLEKRLILGYKHETTRQFFSALTDLYHFYGLFSTRKYVEQFANGVTVMSIYLNRLPTSNSPPLEHSIQQVVKEASLLYCLPVTPLQPFFKSGKLSVQEVVYAYTCWIFAQHFLNRLGGEYSSLQSVLAKNKKNASEANEVLSKLKKRLRSDTFTRAYILEVIQTYPELIKLCYVSFAMDHYINPAQNALNPSLSFQRIQVTPVLNHDELLDHIRKTVANSQEGMIFESFVTFNQHVLKTNFYQPTKIALSFRMDPKFLPEVEYSTPLFGMFFVVGSEFRGFHLRFRDIARGGIRIVKSRNAEAYSINLRSLFDENYGLANTQQRKNKDIPEGGSKGTILLDADQQENPKFAFQKFVDAILDLVIPGKTPGIKEQIVDKYGKPEILFFGPDEGTADYMDWASLHARHRGASFWKAFTTGKSQSMGGIPHDTYGMTTRSVHQYVLGIYEKLGLKESSITKMQTGGPDGDLGSNEILISSDKAIAVVDGSGVLYDPVGIERSELARLATERKMVNHFDAAKLSKDGFRILVDESNIKLPDGTVIHSGLKFRNEFHLNPLASADLFVPCGGRPEAIDISNVQMLLKADGTARFKYIVEGANLFITQEARLKLEAAGVILFKDASANKGGVTSSSLEVLAALAFNDEEFKEHMTVKDGVIPEFYAAYVKSVQEFIESAARLEFEALWREGEKTKVPRSVLSDQLSLGIVKLNEELQTTTLWDNVPLRRLILEEAFPKLLLDKLGLDTLLSRVPEPYVKAIFGCYLASRFVYQYGSTPSQFAFFEFLGKWFEKIPQAEDEEASH
ncbi:Glutamate/Leucine/Phenylalanine/Valine dehydrogenase-domain-containing protein [Chytriomyces sp. MP71]|nr:Glutamate/Leucine/Phenylalanine/Valine dehydrogenase-domain-containing protein [Chytriomyces sp. MP71]